MTEQTGLWRATYTPGNWVVLGGPTVLVIIQPAPARASQMINGLWDVVVGAESIEDMTAELAKYRLNEMPSFGAFFWTDGQMKSLVRGRIKAVDIATGQVVADGEGIQTWSEIGLGGVRQVRIDMEPINQDELLQLPLVVGAVAASAIVLDATEGAIVRSPQQLAVAAAPTAAQEEPAPDASQAEQPEQAPAEWDAAQPAQDDEPVEPVRSDAEPAPTDFEVEPAQDAADDQARGQVDPRLAGLFGERPAEEQPAQHQPVPPGFEPRSEYAGPQVPEQQTGPASPFQRQQPEFGEAQFGRPQGAPAAPEQQGFAPRPQQQPQPGFHGSPAGPQQFGGQPSAESQWAPPRQQAEPQEPAADEAGDLVQAVHCQMGHANPPEAPRCRRCGHPVQGSPQLVRRPVMATLRPSTGDAVDVDRPVLIGRAPTANRVTRDQIPTLLTVPSPSRDISRTHVQVSPEGWDLVVTDLNSFNGTALARPGQAPERLVPGEPVVVYPGCVLDLGDGVTILIDNPRQ